MSGAAISGTPRERARSAAFALLSVAMLIAVHYVLRDQRWITDRGEVLFALGFLAIAGSVAGQLANYVKLPQLTGYLAVGILAGPHGFELFGPSSVKSLTLINGLALALIALQAGAEFTTEMIKRSFKSIGWSTVAQTLIEPPVLCLAFILLAGGFEFTAGLTRAQIIGVGVVFSVIALSKSPAATLALIGETKSKGPLTEHVLGVVVFLDVIVLALFAVAVSLARSTLIPDAEMSLRELSDLGVELFASVAAGTTFGLLIAAFFWLVSRDRMLFIVVFAYAVTAVSVYLHYDTLLVFVVAGFVVTNLTKQGAPLIESTERLSTGVMVVFFATAGAKLDLNVLRESWATALLLVGIRIAVTVIACRVGHAAAKDPPVIKKLGFMGFVSQAGVTIGLVTLAAEQLPGVGAGLATICIAAVGINEMVGPILFKLALAKAGEIGAGGGPDTEELRISGDQPIAKS